MALDEQFQVICTWRDRTATLSVVGELDLATAPVLERALEGLAPQHADAVVVDLRRLTFIDSTGIELLLRAAAAHYRADRMRVVNASPFVNRVLDVAGVRDQLPLVPWEDRLAVEGRPRPIRPL